MVPELMPVAVGTTLLGAATATSLVADRRRFLAPAGGLLVLAAGGIFATLLARRWAETGLLPLHSHYETLLQALAGLVLGAAMLPRRGPVAHRALAAAAVVGLGLGLLALGDDPERLLSTAAVRAFPAFAYYTLKWISYGILLAAVGCAGGRLLDRRTEEGIPQAWDGALHRVVAMGLPCLMASILAGALWHGIVWSAPISGDFSEHWDFAVVLAFLGWLHLRRVAAPASRVPALVLALGGLLMAGSWTFIRMAPGAADSLMFYE